MGRRLTHLLTVLTAVTVLTGCSESLTSALRGDETDLVVDISSHEIALTATAPTTEDYGVLVLDWRFRAQLTEWDDPQIHELDLLDDTEIDEVMARLGMRRVNDGVDDGFFEGPGGYASVNPVAATFRWVPVGSYATEDPERIIEHVADLFGHDLFTVRPEPGDRWVGDLQVDGLRVVGSGYDVQVGDDGNLALVTGPIWKLGTSHRADLAGRAELLNRLRRSFGTTEPPQPRPGTDDPQISNDPDDDTGERVEIDADMDPVELSEVTGSCDLGDLECDDPFTIRREIIGVDQVLVIGTEAAEPLNREGTIPTPGRDRGRWYLTPAWAVSLDGPGVLPGDPVLSAT